MNGRLGQSVGGRIDRSRGTVLLAVGDVLVIVALFSFGLLTHRIDPASSLRYTALTVLPFLVGWALVAPLVGAYSLRARTAVPHAAVIVALAWIGATVVGAAIRASPYFHGGAHVVFVGVTIGVGLVTLVPWRIVVVYAVRQLKP